MLIVLHPDVTPQAQATIEGRVRELGFTPHAISGAGGFLGAVVAWPLGILVANTYLKPRPVS